MRSSTFRRSLASACVVVGTLGSGAQAFGQSPDGKTAQSAQGVARVRVVERGTRKPVASATIDRYVSEVRICDSWRYRIVGDDLLPRQEEPTKKRRAPNVPGTASTWIGSGSKGHAISDADGVALFDRSFDGGATLVASTPTLRGARVVDVKDGEVAPVEIEVAPPCAVEVEVVGPDGRPRAGIPVEFGRFLDGTSPREHGDDHPSRKLCELWDRLGMRVLTDERGRATLTGLEMHGADELDVRRGAEASPFYARAMVLGVTRVVAAVDPDAPPDGPVQLQLPAIGAIDLSFEFPDHQRIDVGGDVQVLAGNTALAPGFQRLFDVEHGRTRLFPVEAGLEGRIGVETLVCDDGTLTATTVQLGGFGDPVFGVSMLPTVVSSCELPRSEGDRVEATLSPPKNWFQVRMRLLDAAKRPLGAVEVETTLAATVTRQGAAPAKKPTSSRRRRFPASKCSTDGRVAILLRRPIVPATLSIEVRAKTPDGAEGRAERPLVLADDSSVIDLGDVVLDR